MLNFLLGLVFLIFLLYMTVLYESTSIYLLSAFVLGVMILSFLYLLILRRKFNVTIETPIGIAQKNERFSIIINVKNSKLLGYRKIRFKVAYKSASQKKYKKMWVSVKSVPYGQSQYSYDLKINSADYYEFKIVKAKYYDLLGVFYLTKRFKTFSNVIIFPEINKIPISVGQGVIHFISDTDIYDEYHPGDDVSEVFDFREYRQGDRISNIHWKLSSKKDELVVKEGSLQKSCPAILIFNSGKNDNNDVYEKITSFSYSMMEEGCAHYFAWISKTQNDIIRMRVDDEESFYEALVMMMQDRENSVVADIKDKYHDKYKNENVLYEILFEDNNIFVNDTLIEDVDQYEMVLG